MKPRDLVIVGTGGFAREVHQLVKDINSVREEWNVLGFLDSNSEKHGSTVHNLPVFGDERWLAGKLVYAVVAIGSPVAKRKVGLKLEEIGAPKPDALVHPTAWIGDEVEIGRGTIICAGCKITCDIRIGEHVIVNLDCTVGHDTEIEDLVTLAPSANISGAVRIGQGCDIGTGAAIIQGKSIGAWSVIGAGTVVVRDVSQNVTAVGNPARIIKTREEGWQYG